MSHPTKLLALVLAMGLAQGAWAQDTAPATGADAGNADATADGAAAPVPSTPPVDGGSDAGNADASADGATAPTPATPPAAPDAAAPTAAAPKATGTTQQPQTYTKATYGDWELQCIKAPDGKDPCQIYQVIKDHQGGNVADISLFGLPKGGQAVAGATIMVPLDTLLTQNLTVQVDGNPPKVYPFTFCQHMGCFARIGLTQADLDAYKKGAKATISIVPLAAPNQKVDADISLKGFTAAYDAVVKSNEDSGAVKK